MTNAITEEGSPDIKLRLNFNMVEKKSNGPRPNLGNLLNLERVPQLAPKFSNKLGKDAAGYAVLYTEEGVKVMVQTKLTIDGRPMTPPGEGKPWPQVSLVEFERRVSLKNAPSKEERLNALKRKYELRLMKEFPSQGPKEGSEESIQSWIGTLPFNDRVALLMSQKDFDKAKSNQNSGFRPN